MAFNEILIAVNTDVLTPLNLLATINQIDLIGESYIGYGDPKGTVELLKTKAVYGHEIAKTVLANAVKNNDPIATAVTGSPMAFKNCLADGFVWGVTSQNPIMTNYCETMLAASTGVGQWLAFLADSDNATLIACADIAAVVASEIAITAAAVSPTAVTALINSETAIAAVMDSAIAKSTLGWARYGFKRARATESPDSRIQYLYDAVLRTPASTNLTTGVFAPGGWETIINDLARPVMKKTLGGIDYELSRSDFTKKADGTTPSDVANISYAGDCFIEFRKYIWVYRYNDETYDYVVFSNIKCNANYKSFATTDKDGIIQNSFLYGAFGGSNIGSKLRSLGVGAYLVSQSRNTEVAYAEANGSCYDTIYKSGWDFICDWLTLISKSDDGQGKFGKGRADTTSASACGTTKDKPMFYGGGNNVNVKVFGIEDFWGNAWQGMRGLILDGANGIKTKMTPPYNFDGAGYITTGIKPSGTSGGYVSTAMVDENGYVPSVASGSQSTYYCDGLYFNNAQVNYALVGGVWANAFLDGPRCVDLHNLASGAYASVGSRLSYVGPDL